MASDLSAGRFIGFAMGVFDGDKGGDSAVHLQLVPEALADPDREVFDDIYDFHADFFLDGLLLPANPTEPGDDSAVESVSWGRIKASLRQ